MKSASCSEISRRLLGLLAKLSNEAVKCCECDASQHTDHNMWIVRRRRHNILVLAQGIEP
jgi:hypothetical protein